MNHPMNKYLLELAIRLVGTALVFYPLQGLTQNYSHNSQSISITHGEGYGLFYSGIGTNIGWHSEDDFKYISVGCMQTDAEEELEEELNQGSGSTNNVVPACSMGFGWVNALDSSGTHGLGIYLGMVDAIAEKNPYTRELIENQAVYGVGVGYVWFPGGLGRSGMNLGVYTTAGRHDGNFTNRVFFQIGFQH